MIAAHNLFDGIRPTTALIAILHGPGFVITGPHTVFASYPLIPWVGVTAAGFALGEIYDWDPASAVEAFLLLAGTAATVAFVVLRAVNVYGDPSRWKHQAATVTTVLSFLNTTKYPPSLLFLLMTLGPALLMLRAVDGDTPGWLRPALVYGKVPMFYYVLHFALLHALAVVVCYARYHARALDVRVARPRALSVLAAARLGLLAAARLRDLDRVVVSLYPACRWFAGVKARRREAWLSYL